MCSSGGTGGARRCRRGPQEDHKGILRASIRTGCPDAEPAWPAFPGVVVLRFTDAGANERLPCALRAALIH